jgi:hypothetical protein
LGRNFSEEQQDTHQRNEEILEEVKVKPVDEKLRRYKTNWLQHVRK